MNKKVEIYSKSNCSYCVMAMNFFDSKGIAYEVYSADDPDIFDEMLKITHFLTQIKINPSLKDEIHIPEADRKMGTDIANKISISSLGSV